MTSAGEVEQFVYCPQNWALARRGVDPHAAASTRGMAVHAEAGKAQDRVELEKREYRRAWAWFFRVLAFACSAAILLLEVLFLKSPPHEIILVGTTALLVGASAGLMLLAIISERDYKRHQREDHLVPGRLVTSDLAGPGQLLHDPEWNLQGRPDQILNNKSGWVPIEFKSGKTPQHPFPNHVQQVGCYLRLIEATTGIAPEYGILNYPEGVFRIAWDDALRTQLKTTLDRIHEAEKTGKADRDHDQAGRCRGCARRDACEQRLG